MKYYLSSDVALKWLEIPAVYDIRGDELYELDEEAFEFLSRCAAPEGCEGKTADKEFLGYCLSEGILTGERAGSKRPPLVKSDVPSLRYLELQITDRCNLACRHCYIGKSQNRELPVSAIKDIMDEFEEMQGLRLLITGGEPLLHGNFDAINRILPDYSFRKILFTNGLLLDRRLINGLNVDEVQFSVDGMEHGHDALRGRGRYRTVMKKIEEALGEGVVVSVSTMVHRENLDEFKEMETLFKRIGIKDWTVDVPCIAGNLQDNPLFHVPPETAGRYLGYGFGEGLHGGGEGFACGLHLVSVLAGGTVAKCAFYSHNPSGTLKEGLRKCWERIRPIRLDELECADLSCPHLEACRGGCRYRAMGTISGEKVADSSGKSSELRRDIYRCYGYGIMKQPGHEARH